MISPSELAATVDGDRALLADAEKRIDAAIQWNYVHGNKTETWIDAKGWTRRTCDELIRRYVAAGWHVRYVPDPRDGNALVFSEKKDGT